MASTSVAAPIETATFLNILFVFISSSFVFCLSVGSRANSNELACFLSFTRFVAERVYSVSDLIRQINLDLFRYHDIAVDGEVTNYVKSSAGHHYFTV